MTTEAKSLEAEDEGGFPVERDIAPRPSWGRRTCSGRRLILILLGVLCSLLLAMVVFGFSGRKLNADLSVMQKNLEGINKTIFSELASLKEKGASEAKLVAKINGMAKNLTEEVKEAKTQFQDQISKLQRTVLTMNCELEDVKHNRTGTNKGICCPKGWLPFARNCYWFSNSEMKWEDAKLDCENKEAHLVIITTYLEKRLATPGAQQLLLHGAHGECGLRPHLSGRPLERRALPVPV
ncbi:asialoglycoprotein receptor 1-like isoform X2 [Anolis sagrei]|uniref:asialoglycoprotein receptor 1-like isoform X2 n=1 Tax=Anolis sagrei TaxID=38937 RepID=UPI003521894E